jgi:hypothetical protein
VNVSAANLYTIETAAIFSVTAIFFSNTFIFNQLINSHFSWFYKNSHTNYV